MRALVFQGEGAAAQWELRRLPEPTPAPGQLLLRGIAAALNRADLHFQPRDHHRESRVPGSEMAGVVLAAGSGCTGFASGDRVMALASGCFTEQIVLDHRLAMRIPSALADIEAAAIPAAYMTAHDALVRLGGISPGVSVLVQGATSGVGIAAMQLARHLNAGLVVAVARSADKLARLSSYFDIGLDATTDWPGAVLAATGGRGIDLVIDLVGGDTLSGHVRCTALVGKIIALGRLGGKQAALDLDHFATRRLTLIGTTFRSRTTDERIAVARHFAEQLLPAFSAGALKPVIDSTFPLPEADLARERVLSGHHLGKVVLDFS